MKLIYRLVFIVFAAASICCRHTKPCSIPLCQPSPAIRVPSIHAVNKSVRKVKMNPGPESVSKDSTQVKSIQRQTPPVSNDSISPTKAQSNGDNQ
jgi:hypothetical protein